MHTYMNSFVHDSNARNDERILALRIHHGAAGYGVYFMLLERLRDDKDYMCVKDYNTLAFDLRVDASLVKSVVECFGLFTLTEDGTKFFSESFSRRMEHAKVVSQRRSAAGRKGGFAKAVSQKGPHTAEPRAVRVKPPLDLNVLAQSDVWIELIGMRYHIDKDSVLANIQKFILDAQCRGVEHRDLTDAKRHFNDWLRINLNEQNNVNNRSKSNNQRRGTDVPPQGETDYTGSF